VPVGGADSGEGPTLDLAVLEAAQHEHDAGANGQPRISAKGLDRNREAQPLTYTAPELGSDAPAVQTTRAEERPVGAGSATARRQQARGSNPNRGSRGNKGGKRRKR
jgi:hypothetical protein